MKLCTISLLFALTLSAQTNTFDGTWKMNIAKSKFSERPIPYKAQTITQTDGKTTAEIVTSDGKSSTWTYSAINGKVVLVEGTGVANTTVLQTISGNTMDEDWTMGTGKAHGHGVASKDGKTIRYTLIGVDFKGNKVHDVQIFEKH
jgi:hypothetical protein